VRLDWSADDLVVSAVRNFTITRESPDPDELFPDTRWEEREIIGAVANQAKRQSGMPREGGDMPKQQGNLDCVEARNGSYEFDSRR